VTKLATRRRDSATSVAELSVLLPVAYELLSALECGMPLLEEEFEAAADEIDALDERELMAFFAGEVEGSASGPRG
jgi:hypothetical protein